MNTFKRFGLGFVLGVGLMYWFLHYADTTKSDTMAWFGGNASKYRGDKRHQAADEALDSNK